MADRIFFCSFNHEQVNRSKQLLPEAHCSYLNNSSSGIEKLIKNEVKNQLDAIVLKYSAVKESIAKKVHEAGLKLGTFTVNDSRQLEKIEFAGADWIITDKASEIRPILWT